MFHHQRGLTGEQVLATTFDWVVPASGRHAGSASRDGHNEAAGTPSPPETVVSAPPTARSLNFESEPSSPRTDRSVSPAGKNLLPVGIPPAASDERNHTEAENEPMFKPVSLGNPPSTPLGVSRVVVAGQQSPSLVDSRVTGPPVAPQTAPPFRRGVGNTAPRMSIHLAAREGWLEVMARMLKDNPAAIKEREMLVSETRIEYLVVVVFTTARGVTQPDGLTDVFFITKKLGFPYTSRHESFLPLTGSSITPPTCWAFLWLDGGHVVVVFP